jgi:hypothetical protein
MVLSARSLLAVMLAALLAAGCTSGGSGDPSDPAEQSGPWPLTGLPGYPEGSRAQVVVVKVDDTTAGQPQVGLEDADLVVQQMVEGGATRLAVMYLSSYPTAVSPVRSMRQTDIGIVLPTGGTLAASGGEAATVAAIGAAGIPVAVEGGPGFARDPSRSAPYNLVLDVGELAGALPDGPPPGPYLQFGSVPADSPGEPASGLELSWPIGGSQFSWDAGSGQWERTSPGTQSGAFTNVIALTLQVAFLGGRDASGTPIPTMITEGTGTGVVATGGEVHEVAWSKASSSAPWQFTHLPPGVTEPVEFPVPSGRTWLALLPPEGEVSVEPAAAAQASATAGP